MRRGRARKLHMHQSELDRFRHWVMADPALQAQLATIEIPDAFVAAAGAIAAQAGIALTPESLRAGLAPDPLGLEQWHPAPIATGSWPPLAWLPCRAMPIGDALEIDWAHFAGLPLTAPFFEDTLRRVTARPFNRLFRTRTRLSDFVAQSQADDAPAPDGFIFHMSRCGSTLVSQALGGLPGALSVSEAPALDALVQYLALHAELPEAWQDAALRAMVAALCRPRAGEHRRFVKLDSWHILALPRFRRAFPDTPWIFLHRDGSEVLVSQMRMRGIQTLPDIMPPGLYGLGDTSAMPQEEVCARVLARLCAAALAGRDAMGRMLSYAALPDAIVAQIVPHFGLVLDDADRAALDQATQRNAKQPDLTFRPDAASKRDAATPAIREAARRYLDPVVAALDAVSPARS